MKKLKGLCLWIWIMLLWSLTYFSSFVFATGERDQLSEAITSSNVLLTKLSGEMETRTEDVLGLDEDNEDFLFQKGYGLSHCEINGEEVPCEERFADIQAILSSFLQEIPFLRTMGSWAPFFIQFGIIVALFFLVCSFFWFLFWIWMLIDAIKYQEEGRVVWILVIVCFNILGALVYLFAAKMGRKEVRTE